VLGFDIGTLGGVVYIPPQLSGPVFLIVGNHGEHGVPHLCEPIIVSNLRVKPSAEMFQRGTTT
jgi:hypothetical protein